jgi:hypothetical protein
MKNIDLLHQLKKKLPAERFVIGGSNAMKLHGVKLAKEPGDLDIILEKPMPHAISNLELFQATNPNPKFTGNANMSYSFYIDNIKVDVWIRNHANDEVLLQHEGFYVNSIRDIVEAKTLFNRAKDWIQLMQWASSIFNKSTFSTSLPDIGGTEEYKDGVDADREEKKMARYDPLDSYKKDDISPLNAIIPDDDLPY